jgi:hypothetical protein
MSILAGLARRPERGEKTDMKFLMMIKHAEAKDDFKIPDSLNAAMGALVEKGFKDGFLKDTAGLKRTSAAWRIKSKGGKLTRTDGPFTESKEVVGGYAIIETKTKEEAEALAQEFMEIHRVHVPDFECECEVRPLEDF